MNPIQMFIDASWVGKAVIFILIILSVYSIAVMIDKFRSYKAARKESLEFLPHFVRNLKDNNFAGALESARKYKRSHIAKVVSAGLIEYDNDKAELHDSHDLVGAVGRALDRAVSLTAAEMKKGTGGLATIGSAAPFIGLFGTVVGIINAFTGIAASGSGGLATVSAGISEALITTAFGIFVAVPAVMAFNYFTTRLERFQIEMSNSSAELLDFFLKKHEAASAKR
ncbi:MAG TPA: MotA/TolQ/ExbB proton channel family protein [Candidatus Polarisedimenticolaceae bacterium]|nr:MotA/TolQ/ExbB proton channel family protein [Candidatus Polarisedimenticolaceae bacterium]